MSQPPLTDPLAAADRSARPRGRGLQVVAALLIAVVAIGAIVAGVWFAFLDGGKKKKRRGDADDAATVDPQRPFPKALDVPPWADEDCPVPITSRDAHWGSRTAPVTLVVFSDFEIEAGAPLATQLATLRVLHGESKLRIVWKAFPADAGKQARPAALAALSVYRQKGADGFWRFHDAAFAGQKELGIPKFEEWSTAAGLDVQDFRLLYAANTMDAKVNEDLALGRKLGLKQSPAVFANGRLLDGTQLATLNAAVEAEAASAAAELAKGTPADKVYVTRAKANYKAPGDRDKPLEPPPASELFRVPVDGSPALGPKTAKVTLVEFGDAQCPYCGKVQPTLKALKTKYGDDLRIVYKHRILKSHEDAPGAAQLLAEAREQKGDAGFFSALDLLYQNQKALSKADLLGHASKLGLAVAKVGAAIDGQKHKKDIDLDEALATRLGVSGIPAFFINGRKLSGAQAQEKFEAVIAAELERANKLLASGVAPDKLYDELTKDGAASAGPLDRLALGDPPADAPWWGAKDGAVVIQEFGDFQCPFCRKVQPTLEQLVAEYPGKIRVVFRHLPLSFHKQAALAAEAAQEAWDQKGTEGYVKYTKKLWESQLGAGLERDALEQYARDVGLDVARFKRALDSGKHSAKVEADKQFAAKNGVSATPTFSVGGYKVSGAGDVSKFRAAVDKALAEKKP